MPIEILMPALSPTMQEGKIINWLKNEGDKISPSDILVEIETDKAIMELDTPFKGTLGKILISNNTSNVAVGTLIGLLLKDGEDASTLLAYQTTNDIPKVVLDTNKNQSTAIEEKSLNLNATMAPSDSTLPKNDRKFISPLAKKIALQNNIDYSMLQGSGPNNRIVADDVRHILANKTNKSSNENIIKRNQVSYTESQISGMRNVIATRLTESKSNIPHFYLNFEIKMDKLLDMRESVNKYKTESKISVNDLIVRATAIALEKHPQVNSSWSNNKILHYNNIDISVAVSIPNGLITPIVKNANQKDIFQISAEIKNLATKAKEGKLTSDEYVGGGITISNMGMFGVNQFCAIINPPQSCILAIGATTKKVIVDENDEIQIANICNITLSADHRLLDGNVVANFGNEIKSILESPILLLI